MDHIKYPSIGQFRNVIYQVNRTHEFVGLDENNEPIYDKGRPKPTLTFKGTVKIHGTNAAVCYNDTDGIYYQSRKNIITPEKDNAGFAKFAESNKDVFLEMFDDISCSMDTKGKTIAIYGEWAGQGIQKKVAVSQLPKSFFIFGLKIENDPVIKPTLLRSPENRIYNIHHFQTFSIDIDFNNPGLSQNKIIEETIKVEEECPVGKALGISGIGEGIVFSCQTDKELLMFKSKGEKHSKSRVKTLKAVDAIKLLKIKELAEEVTPKWRLEQFLNEVCDLSNGGQITRDKISPFIRAVIKDAFKEDMDIIEKAGINSKDLGKPIADICRKYFFEQELT